MKNKRIINKLHSQAMSAVNPMNVSPLIKLSRWSLLILGLMYGTQRYSVLKAYDDKVREKRLKVLHDEKAAALAEIKQKTINELKDVLKDIGEIEPEPGWEDDV